jgi:Fur family transcriptional regulator, ferric uptake regulator
MSSTEILNRFELSKTPCRIDILNTLLSSPSALSETELRKKLTYKYERSTVFRTIRSFLDTGIIHSVSCEGELQYAINPEKNKPHAHFKCSKCGQISCITTIRPGKISMPKGFISQNISMLIRGTCKQCNARK